MLYIYIPKKKKKEMLIIVNQKCFKRILMKFDDCSLVEDEYKC